MTNPQVIPDRSNVINLQERRLDRTVLRTYRTKADIDDIVPNEKQPRLGPKIDEELQRQIEANGGLFEPLLVEPHPHLPGKFGIIDGELDKLVEVFELSEKFTTLRDPGAAITWARELMGVSKKLLTPSVVEAVVRKVNQKRITNSKDLRKLRAILPDPVARSQFLSDAGDLESAMLRLGPAPKPVKGGLSGDLEAAVDAMKKVPFSALQELKGDVDILKKIDEAEALLRSLRGALS